MGKDVTLKERMVTIEVETRHAKETALSMTTTCKETHKALDATIKSFSEQMTTQEDKLKELATAVDKIQKTLDNGLSTKIVQAIRNVLDTKQSEKEQTGIQKITALAPYAVAVISAIVTIWVTYLSKI